MRQCEDRTGALPTSLHGHFLQLFSLLRAERMIEELMDPMLYHKKQVYRRLHFLAALLLESSLSTGSNRM